MFFSSQTRTHTLVAFTFKLCVCCTFMYMQQIDVCELLGSLFSYRCWSMGFFRRFDNSPRLKFFGTSEFTNMRVCFECVCMSACKFVCIAYTHTVDKADIFHGNMLLRYIRCAIDFMCILSSMYYFKDKNINLRAFACVQKKNLRQCTKFYQLTK